MVLAVGLDNDGNCTDVAMTRYQYQDVFRLDVSGICIRQVLTNLYANRIVSEKYLGEHFSQKSKDIETIKISSYNFHTIISLKIIHPIAS